MEDSRKRFSKEVFIKAVRDGRDYAIKSQGINPNIVELSPFLFSRYENIPQQVDGIRVKVSAYLQRDDALYFRCDVKLPFPNLFLKDKK